MASRQTRRRVRVQTEMQAASAAHGAISSHAAQARPAKVSQRLSRVLPDDNSPESRCRAGVNLGFHGMLYRQAILRAADRYRTLTPY